MVKDKKKAIMELVTADVIAAITEETDASVQEAMSEFYNSEAFDRLCDPETGLYRESGGYVHALYKNWDSLDDGWIF